MMKIVSCCVSTVFGVSSRNGWLVGLARIVTFIILKTSILALLLIPPVIPVSAQRFISPLDFPLQLSGGFGDLRANHFHAGIDFRTKSSEGHPIHAVLDGYISRVSVSPGGYGLAVYVTHPADKFVTVHGHLQRFSPILSEIVKGKQYENESFSVNITFNEGEIPVKQGEIIGFSGNSGGSSGPHLHFEVRDLGTNDWLDPLTIYKSHIIDTQKPQFRGLVIYPIEGKGTVNGSANKQNIELRYDKNGHPTVIGAIKAWGEIGIGIRAIDRMNGTNFSYGIKDILMTADSVEMFRSAIDRISQDESKYINSYTDYIEWSYNRSFIIKTFVAPGNNARFVASRNAGKIIINEERIYNAVITLTDHYDNVCRLPVKIQGVKQVIAQPDTVGTTLLRWYDYNAFSARGIRLTCPRYSLYDNINVRYNAYSEEKYESPVHTLHTSPVPLHYPAHLSIYVDSSLKAENTNQYGIVELTYPNYRRSWIGGVYRDGWIDTEINELGVYTVVRDTTPPKITPINPAGWSRKKKIDIRITDNLSGIASFRGEIDGAYVLFEYDSKNSMLNYTYDEGRLQPGRHQLKLIVTDRCGNQAELLLDI